MKESEYYARMVKWIKDVVNDEELSDEKKVRLLGRVL